MEVGLRVERPPETAQDLESMAAQSARWQRQCVQGGIRLVAMVASIIVVDLSAVQDPVLAALMSLSGHGSRQV